MDGTGEGNLRRDTVPENGDADLLASTLLSDMAAGLRRIHVSIF